MPHDRQSLKSDCDQSAFFQFMRYRVLGDKSNSQACDYGLLDGFIAVGLEANLIANLAERDAHCRSARVGSGGSVRVG